MLLEMMSMDVITLDLPTQEMEGATGKTFACHNFVIWPTRLTISNLFSGEENLEAGGEPEFFAPFFTHQYYFLNEDHNRRIEK